MIDEDRNITYMSLDELIVALQEAKDHCVDGRSKVLVRNRIVNHPGYITDIKFDSKNVIITYE